MKNSILLGDAMEGQRNNLDIIRLIAALMVLVSHSYPLTGINYEPFAARLGGYDTGGGLAVSAFFVISGLLIAKSAARNDWSDFAISRVLRIVPALAVVVCLQFFVIGPIFTTLGTNEYLKIGVGHLAGIFVFDVKESLPGVFQNLPITAVNGSLWTLPVEAVFYIFTALFCAFGVLKRSTALPLALISIAVHLALQFNGFDWAKPGPEVIAGITAYNFSKLFAFYFLGAAAWFLRDHLRLDFSMFIMIVILMYLARIGVAKSLAYFLGWTYIILFLGFHRYVRVGPYEKMGDLSYGTYLYAFPIQQSIVAISGKEIGPHKLALVSIPVTLIFAYISWKIVEKPSLGIKQRMRLRSPVSISQNA